MCGLGGVVGEYDPSRVKRLMDIMGESLSTRGPDGVSSLFSSELGFGLIHSRLAINDLSDASKQPLVSQSMRYCIVFNGEIYNFRELRKHESIRSYRFKSTGDSEVLLALIERVGLETALNLIKGMFAFAVFDKMERRLTLARDIVGEKPLCYNLDKGKLIFGSEIRSVV